MRSAIVSFAGADFADQRMLDFGAGCGRVLSFFEPEVASLYAADVDESATRYLAQAFPDVEVRRSDFDPPLPYANGFFDIVYSVSVWTHLPLDNQMTWLAEMKRIVRPGGLVLITTSGYTALRRNQEKRQVYTPRGMRASGVNWNSITPEQLGRDGIIYHEYQQFANGERDPFPGVRRSYGMTAHSPDYIRRHWTELFEVLAIEEGVIDNLQDLVVLRRPASD
jgi:SAM-dependent methyltransferase